MKNGQRKLGQYLCKKWYSLAIPAVVLLCASFFMSAPHASALTTVPTKTNFQGRLTNSAGNIMADGTYNMKFRLFTVGSGGSSVWSEDRLVSATQGVTVTNGLFSVKLGDITSLPASLFASGALYLEVELPTPATATSGSPVWTEGPMTPRNQLATSAYAYNAETLDGFDSADFGKLVANNTWTATNLFTGTTDVNSAHFGSTATEIIFAPGASGFTLTGNALFQTGTFSVANNSPLFKNASNNAAAFSIQTSTNANLFVANTSTSRIHIGDPVADASGVVLVLDTKNDAGDPTGVAGAMYYNSNTGKFRCYQVSAWKECGLDTLQDSYTASTGGTTPEIKLDATRGGLDIQDADTTIGASLLAVRGSNGAGLGAALLNVTSTGVITAQNSADSAAAFTISRAGAGGSLFVADTTNSRIQIGTATADTTGIVLVLDTKNNAGDPTGVDGAMYYNSSMHAFRCYQNDVWRSCLGGLAYANTTPSSAISNNAADTAFDTSHTIPAGSCQTGRVYRVTARGVYSTYNAGLGNPGAIAIRVKVGGTTVGTATSVNFGNSLANRGWRTDFNITCANYASNLVEGQGSTEFSTTTSAVQPLEMANAATVAVPSLASAQTITVTADWVTANAGNTITLRQLVVEELGP